MDKTLVIIHNAVSRISGRATRDDRGAVSVEYAVLAGIGAAVAGVIGYQYVWPFITENLSALG